MRIENLRRERVDDTARASATVVWEDCDRPTRDIYIETDLQFEAALTGNPDAFVTWAMLPAMRHGERRLRVEGRVCPQLRNGLDTAQQVLRSWYGAVGHGTVEIEATKGFTPARPASAPRAASFMSGGVDALATLRSNRLALPLDHPASIQDCLFVHGVDVGGYEDLDANREHSRLAIRSLTEFADAANMTLIPVSTNLRHLDDDDYYFARSAHGALLAAVAHAFSSRISTVRIASSFSVRNLTPHGSHPVLDPCYNSAALSVLHDGIRLTRLQKVQLISEWPAALETLRACFDPFRGAQALNCGKCEKCIRTMTELLVFDKLKLCSAFPEDDVTPAMIDSLQGWPEYDLPGDRRIHLRTACGSFSSASTVPWHELAGRLEGIGRDDLDRAICQKLREWDRGMAWAQGTGWRGAVRRIAGFYPFRPVARAFWRIRAGFQRRSTRSG